MNAVKGRQRISSQNARKGKQQQSSVAGNTPCLVAGRHRIHNRMPAWHETQPTSRLAKVWRSDRETRD